MTTDLWCLVGAVALTWILIMIPANAKVFANHQWAMGNRDKDVDAPEWVRRADRAAENMKENLPLFVALVLVAHVSGQADGSSALGSEIFLGARIVHAGIYLAGVGTVRTLVWAVSLVGLALIGYSLVS